MVESVRCCRACGLSRKMISKGIREIDEGFAAIDGRIRRLGAGRKPLTVSDPGLGELLPLFTMPK